jgi:hypothetical protein
VCVLGGGGGRGVHWTTELISVRKRAGMGTWRSFDTDVYGCSTKRNGLPDGGLISEGTAEPIKRR